TKGGYGLGMYKLIAFSALAALWVGGCNKKKEEGGTAAMAKEDKGGARSPESGGAVTINGSGSTFQKPYQEIAVEAFTKSNASVKINYGGGGSGKGRQDLADQVVDFAGADSPYKDADLAKNKGGDVLYFPILL